MRSTTFWMLSSVTGSRMMTDVALLNISWSAWVSLMTRDMSWPSGDWRNLYFSPDKLGPILDRVERLRADLPADMSMPELALRFILSNPAVSTIIPGMRKLSHVKANIASSDAGPLPAELLKRLKEHRWERKPAPWSQ